MWERATVEFVLLVPLALLCVLTNRLLPWAALLCGLFLAGRIYRVVRGGLRTVFDRRRLAPFVGLFLFMLAVSALITIDPDHSYPQIQRVLVGVVTCLTIRDWAQIDATHQRIRLLHMAGVGLGMALALVSPFVVEWQGSKLPNLIPPAIYISFPLLTADGANPNVMAGALVILWPLALSPLLGWGMGADTPSAQASWAVQLLFWLGAISMLVILVLTQSRGAWMGSAAGVLVLANLRLRRLRVITTFLIAASLILVLALPTQRTHIAEVLSSGGNISGSAERIEIWTHALYVIQDFSFTGVGMGNFHRVNELFYPLYIASPDAPHAHNLFLQVAVDLGIPGLLAWLGIFIHSIVAAIQAYRYTTSSQIRALSAGLVTAQVALAVHGLTDAAVWGVMRTAIVIWLVWGLANALCVVNQRRLAS